MLLQLQNKHSYMCNFTCNCKINAVARVIVSAFAMGAVARATLCLWFQNKHSCACYCICISIWAQLRVQLRLQFQNKHSCTLQLRMQLQSKHSILKCQFSSFRLHRTNQLRQLQCNCALSAIVYAIALFVFVERNYEQRN